MEAREEINLVAIKYEIRWANDKPFLYYRSSPMHINHYNQMNHTTTDSLRERFNMSIIQYAVFKMDHPFIKLYYNSIDKYDIFAEMCDLILDAYIFDIFKQRWNNR